MDKKELMAKVNEALKANGERELSLDEMEEVPGGKIHFEPQKDKPGWIQHKVTQTETLIREIRPLLEDAPDTPAEINL